MTAQVLHSPSHFSSSTTTLSFNSDTSHHTLRNPNPVGERETQESEREREEEEEEPIKEEKEEEDQLSLLALLLTVFRKSLVTCRVSGCEELRSMEIGWPTDVQHVAHVTFDRFNGFLGLPVEFEPEVPRRAPSASTNVFGVSTESMQCSYDSRGNSVPTILLMMQRRLYSQGGLQAEGIFRINAENSQEEYVRDQLNRGNVPDGIDVHCLAGLIKAWFRELPSGVLDSLTPEQVMQSQSEEDCAQLLRFLPPTEAALLDWAVNLMADVVQEEHHNKMNAHNIAMVFAPNMTQMADPLTALMYAVQVMNFLKTLIIKALRERENPVVDNSTSASHSDPADENGHQSTSQPYLGDDKNEEKPPVFVATDPILDSESHLTEESNATENSDENAQNSSGKAIHDNCPSVAPTNSRLDSEEADATANVDALKSASQVNVRRNKTGQSSNSNIRKGARKVSRKGIVRAAGSPKKSRETSIVSRINSRIERVEAWR